MNWSGVKIHTQEAYMEQSMLVNFGMVACVDQSQNILTLLTLEGKVRPAMTVIVPVPC